jgi:hypothetical protein
LGRGAITVSGLNHARAAGQPIGEWVLGALVDVGPTRRPGAVLPRSLLEQGAVEPGCLAGYVRLTAPPSETALWHTYREDMVPGHFCRQTSPTNVVAWETAPAPARGVGGPETVRFAFAGGVGYRSEPDAGGFRLWVNDRLALEFDLTAETKVWKSTAGRITLRFDVKRPLELDALGFFYLTVPTDGVVAGQPVRLRVESKGSGSRRWFALHPYTDLVDD